MATIDTQKKALAAAEDFKKKAGAHRLELEKKIKTSEDAVKFRDETAQRMTIMRQGEAKKLAESLATVETSKSQAQIAWDRHEKTSNQLKEAQEDLAKAKEAQAKEADDFRRHRQENDKILLQMHSWVVKIVEGLATLKVKGLPAPPRSAPTPSGATHRSWSSWPRASAALGIA